MLARIDALEREKATRDGEAGEASVGQPGAIPGNSEDGTCLGFPAFAGPLAAPARAAASPVAYNHAHLHSGTCFSYV